MPIINSVISGGKSGDSIVAKANYRLYNAQKGDKVYLNHLTFSEGPVSNPANFSWISNQMYPLFANNNKVYYLEISTSASDNFKDILVANIDSNGVLTYDKTITLSASYAAKISTNYEIEESCYLNFCKSLNLLGFINQEKLYLVDLDTAKETVISNVSSFKFSFESNKLIYTTPGSSASVYVMKCFNLSKDSSGNVLTTEVTLPEIPENNSKRLSISNDGTYIIRYPYYLKNDGNDTYTALTDNLNSQLNGIIGWFTNNRLVKFQVASSSRYPSYIYLYSFNEGDSSVTSLQSISLKNGLKPTISVLYNNYALCYFVSSAFVKYNPDTDTISLVEPSFYNTSSSYNVGGALTEDFIFQGYEIFKINNNTLENIIPFKGSYSISNNDTTCLFFCYKNYLLGSSYYGYSEDGKTFNKINITVPSISPNSGPQVLLVLNDGVIVERYLFREGTVSSDLGLYNPIGSNYAYKDGLLSAWVNNSRNAIYLYKQNATDNTFTQYTTVSNSGRYLPLIGNEKQLYLYGDKLYTGVLNEETLKIDLTESNITVIRINSQITYSNVDNYAFTDDNKYCLFKIKDAPYFRIYELTENSFNEIAIPDILSDITTSNFTFRSFEGHLFQIVTENSVRLYHYDNDLTSLSLVGNYSLENNYTLNTNLSGFLKDLDYLVLQTYNASASYQYYFSGALYRMNTKEEWVANTFNLSRITSSTITGFVEENLGNGDLKVNTITS